MARPRTNDESVRLRLLEAASEQVAYGGAAAVSLRSVASQARTTTAAIYSLFGGREALIQAVIEEGFRRFAANLATVEQTKNAWEDLVALGIAYRQNALSNPHFYRVMFTEGVSNTAHPTFERLMEAVARIRDDGPDRTQDRSLRVWSYVHGLVMLELAELVPGDLQQRDAYYRAALQSAESLILR